MNSNINININDFAQKSIRDEIQSHNLIPKTPNTNLNAKSIPHFLKKRTS